ncbi:MAG: hypothetical protein QXL96_11820, partial [Ignisphaera sp.]
MFRYRFLRQVNKLKVLLVGSGGREHALAKLIRRSTQEPRIFVAMDYRNPG